MTWDDYQHVGAALAAAYPKTNHLTIGNDALTGLVRALPDFDGAPLPPDVFALSAIVTAWAAVVDDIDDGEVGP